MDRFMALEKMERLADAELQSPIIESDVEEMGLKCAGGYSLSGIYTGKNGIKVEIYFDAAFETVEAVPN